MTVDRLEGELHGFDSEKIEALPISSIVSLCDELVGEASRRHHLFAWLRPPGGDAEEWLPVDAYYPRRRVVVVCRTERTGDDQLYRELVPQHGLQLLVLTPSELGIDRAGARDRLAEMLAALSEPDARPLGPRAPTPPPAAAAPPMPRHPEAARPQQGRDARQPRASLNRRRPPSTGNRSPARAAKPEGSWVVVGLALAFALAAELYVAVVVVALGAGLVLLGVVIGLDAFARAAGAIAAERSGSKGWSWACVIGGAPAAVLFAVHQRRRYPPPRWNRSQGSRSSFTVTRRGDR